MGTAIGNAGELLMQLLVYGGGPVVIAFLTFKFLGEKWIDSKFAAQLKATDHANDIKLKELQREIDTQLSRVVKIQDREFQVLPKVWELLQDALDHLGLLVATARQWPELSNMSVARFNEFVDASPLTPVHKDELRQKSAADRNQHYHDLMFWYELTAANNACVAYRDHVKRNSIFLRQELRETFLKIDVVMWEALLSRRIGQEAQDTKLWVGASQMMQSRIAPLVTELEGKVQALLHDGK
jgi:hypothetical protein